MPPDLLKLLPFASIPRGRARLSCLVAGAFGLTGLFGAESGFAASPPQGPAWVRHVIDQDGRGADGTKLADINGDGWPDVVTGWEEDGSTRVYLNPGPVRATGPWARVIVGSTPSAEDAVFADLDGDGSFDVVSSTEGATRQIFVHWAPPPAALLDASAWKQDSIPAAQGVTRWMFAQPLPIDGQHGPDLVIAGKKDRGQPNSFLGWLQAPPTARDVGAWKWHPLTATGWTMSVELEDMDGDADADILYSDRYGPTRGIFWLENPGPAAAAAGEPWPRHAVDGSGKREIMFLDTGDIDGDGRRDVVAGVILERTRDAEPDRASRIACFRRLDATGRRWSETMVGVPANTGSIKAVAIGDVDGDGRADLVASCENASRGRIGVYWMRQDAAAAGSAWPAYNIAGPAGVKFDLVRLLDLDADGDLDVLTNEEREGGGGLGVVWYENPGRGSARASQ